MHSFPSPSLKRLTYESFRRSIGPTFLSELFPQVQVAIDPFPLVLENVKAKSAITVRIDSAAKCVWPVPGGVVVGGDSGSVTLVSGRTEEISLGKHRKEVQCFTGVKNVFASGSHDGEIKVWSVSEKRETASLGGNRSVGCLAMTSDCRLLFSGSDDGHVACWSLATFAHVRKLKGHTREVSCLALSVCGKTLFSGSFDNTVKVWSVETGDLDRTLAGHGLEITAIIASPDGKCLASASKDTTVVVWDLATRTKQVGFDGHSMAVCALAVTQDSQFLLSASADKTIKLWSLEEMKHVATFAGHTKEVNCVLVTSDGKYAVSGSSDDSVRVWSMSDYCEVIVLKGHTDCVLAVAIVEHGSRLISASRDCSIKYWCFDDQQTVFSIYSHTASVTALSFTPNGRYLISASADCSLRSFDLKLMTEKATFVGHSSRVTCMVLSPDSKLAISGSNDSRVKVWCLVTNSEMHTFSGHEDGINDLAITPDGRLVISVSRDHSAKVWDLLTMTQCATLLGHKDSVMCVTVIASGEAALTGSRDKSIKFWNLHSFTEIRSFNGHSSAVLEVLIPENEVRFFSRGSEGCVKVWSFERFGQVETVGEKKEFVTCLAVSSDDRLLVTGAKECFIRIRDASTLCEIATLTGHESSISSLLIAPDNLHLVSSALDSTILIYNFEYMKEVARIVPHSSQVKKMILTKDGMRVVSGGEDGSVRLADLTTVVDTLRVYPEGAPMHSTLSELGKNSFFGSAIDMMKKGLTVHPCTASKMVTPYCFNGLHVCCFFNHADLLCTLLRGGVPIIKGSFGSPFTVALKRNTRKCVDICLEHLINKCKHETGWSEIQAVTDDIPKIIATNSPLIMPLLQSVFRVSNQPHLPYFIIPKSPLPIVQKLPFWFVHSHFFENHHSKLPQEVVDFLLCDFRWDFSSGSSKSLELLTALEASGNKAVLTTPFVSTMIQWKWNYLMPVTVSLTVVYVGLLLCMIMIVFGYGNPLITKTTFFVLNLFLLIYECLQSYIDIAGYWKDPWNYLDWARSTLCTVWVFYLNGHQYIDLMAVCMCFFRGFTYFRTFKMTRMFVRLTLEVVKEMYSFLIIFAYSTIAFGMMYAVLIPQHIDSAFMGWVTAYELLMGTYTTEGFGGLQWLCFTFASLVNVIIMLNLLIAILSDAYEQAQMSAKENDILEMLRIIIEYESMMFWRRGEKRPTVFAVCRATMTAEADSYWEGKISEIAKAIKDKIAASEANMRTKAQGSDQRFATIDEKLLAASGAVSKLTKQLNSMRESVPQLDTHRHSFKQFTEGRLKSLEGKVADVESRLDRMLDSLSNHMLNDSAKDGLLNQILTLDPFAAKSSPSDSFLGVLDYLKTKMALTVQIYSGVRRIALCSEGIVAGMDDGTVALVNTEAEIDIMGKHKKSVRCVHGVGDTFATGSADATIKVWDMQQLSEVATLTGHSDWVRCVLITPDESFLLSGSDDNSIKIWSLDDFKDCCTLRAHEGAISCLLLSPDETEFVSSSYDNTIRVWTMGTWEEVTVLTGHSRPVTCITFTPDGAYLVSGSEDAKILIWRWTSKKEIACLDAHTQAVLCLAVSPDGERLVSGAADQKIKVWSLKDFGEIGTMVGHTKDVDCVAVTNNGKYIWSSGGDSFIKVWSAIDLKEIATLKNHSDSILCLAMFPDGRHVISGSKDNTLKIWSYTDSSEIRILGKHQETVTAIALSSNGHDVVTGSADSSLKVWSLETMSEIGSLLGHSKAITDILILCDGSTVISSSEDTTLKVWTCIDLQAIATLEGHSATITKIGVTNDNDSVFSLSADNTVKIWDLNGYKERATLVGHKSGVTCYCRCGSNLVTGSVDGLIKVWNLATFTEIASLIGHSTEITALHSSGDSIISGSRDGIVKLWDTADYSVKVTIVGHTRAVRRLSVLPKDDQLITAAEDKLVRVWNLSDGEEVAVLTGHKNDITAADLTGHFLVTGACDSLIKVWSLIDMREVASYPAHNAKITALLITPFTHIVISGSDDGVINCTTLPLKVAGLRDYPKLPFTTGFSDAGTNSLTGAAVEKLKSGSLLHKDVAATLILPYYLNALHICAYYNHSVSLADYLRMGIPIIRGSFGSPLSLALKRNTIKCIKVILEHLILLCETNSSWNSMQEITEDLPQLLISNTPQLEAFFALLLRPVQQQRLPQFIMPKEELPIVSLSPFWFVQAKNFEDTESGYPQEVVEFLTSNFRWNFAIGSEDSLQFLCALENCDDRGVLTTPIISSLIISKWEKLMPMTISLTILYTGLLLTMVGVVFHYGNNMLMKGLFLGINGFFLVYEGVQSMVNGIEYWKDPWNYLDWVRSIMCMLWVLFLEGQRYVELLAVCMCFFRGFTYFRTFKMTRMFVRLTLEVVKEMYTFLIIVAYSTIAFGMMYAVLVPHVIDSAFKAWMTAYELLMGTYTTEGFNGLQWLCFTSASLVNVIIMLNLLIAILGDAYEQAQLSAKENDTLEMLRIVIEYESMIFWRRESGSPSVIVKCWALNTARVKGEWEGKVNQITKAVREEIKRGEVRADERAKAQDSKLASVSEKITGIEGKFAVLSGMSEVVENKCEEVEERVEGKLRDMEAKLARKIRKIEDKIERVAKAVKGKRH